MSITGDVATGAGENHADDAGQASAITATPADLAPGPEMIAYPGELIGYGPIPAGMARSIATDATWRRPITDPITGHLLDYSTRTYHPPTKLANCTHTRDRTCRFPGCHQPATHVSGKDLFV